VFGNALRIFYVHGANVAQIGDYGGDRCKVTMLHFGIVGVALNRAAIGG